MTADMDNVEMNSSQQTQTIATHTVPEEAPLSTPSRKRPVATVAAIAIALFLSLFISALDQTVTATAAPTISTYLNSASGYSWIGGAYLLANATSGPLWSKCSDIWGRKPLILWLVGLSAAGSLQAALSRNISVLVSARVIQGAAGGGLIQLVLIIIADLLSQKNRTLALGLTEVVWALAGGVGPTLGGALTQYVSWRWCFWINLPLCGIAFLLLALFLDVHNPRTKIVEGIQAIDWLGTITMIGAVLMTLLGLNFGGVHFSWASPTVICLIVSGACTALLFIYGEKKIARFPIMPIDIFSTASNNAVLAVCFTHGAVFIAAEYYLPLYFQAVRNASPLRSGILVLPVIVTGAAFGLATGLVMHRTGRYREIILIGMATLTLGTGLLILLDTDTPLIHIVIFQIITGAGAGCVFAPPMIAIQATVKQAETAAAIATVGLIQNLGLAISVVLGGVVFQNGMDNQANSLRQAGLNSTLQRQFSGREAAAHISLLRVIEDNDQRLAVENAFADSLRTMWIMFTCIAATGFVAAVFIVPTQLSREHTETMTGIHSLSRRNHDD